MSSRPVWNPKDYQKRGIKLLLSQASGGLFLDPGLGKTSITLATLKILLARNLIGKTLIVAPLYPAYAVWPAEIDKWEDFFPLRWTVLHGDQREAKLQADADIYIINPEGLKWLLTNPRRPEFDVLVVDESSKFKDSTTERFKLLKPSLPLFKRRWILTGTPTPNGVGDLFGQIYILDLGRSLGAYITHYRKEYFWQKSMYEWMPRPDTLERVIDRISPLVLQLSAEDYLQMPELVYRNVRVALPDAALSLYREMEKDFITVLGETSIVAPTGAVAGVKCRQLANGAVYHAEGEEYVEVHEAKLDALESLLGELEGHPVLLLYEFDHDRERILRRLGNKKKVEVLRSGLSPQRLTSTIQAFNVGAVPILMGHPASMGHGLNLQGACHHVVWFSPTWNLEYHDQTIARVYRQGQKNSHVFVYHLVAERTLDERVLKVLQEKDKDQQKLLAALHQHRMENYE